MPSLSEQLQELKALKSDFDTALQKAQALQGENIENAVQSAIDERINTAQNAIKSELSNELSANLAQKSEANKAFLANECEKSIETRFLHALDDKKFLQKLDTLAENAAENKIEQKLEHFAMLVLQFKNATSCFKLCLANELFQLSEALKTIAQIEFYEHKLRENGVINKAYQVR